MVSLTFPLKVRFTTNPSSKKLDFIVKQKAFTIVYFNYDKPKLKGCKFKFRLSF